MPDNTSYDTNTTMDAFAFINTIGVNTHVSTGANGYGSVTNVVDDLAYLGVDNVRDGDNGTFSSLETMAAAGIKFDFLLAGGGAMTSTILNTEFSTIDSLNEEYSGSVVAVEGANEINNFPITYDGDSGSAAAVALQEDIYTDAKADTNLPGVNVIYYTGYGFDAGPNPNPATTSGLADYDNQHPYSQNGAPPMQYVNRTTALTNESPATGAAVYTETGYSNTSSFGDTNLGQYGQAVYTLDLLLDDAVQGISSTYLYELMEEGDGMGLFDADNNPTEAATALHNMTSILADSGTVTTTGVNYTIHNLPSDGNSMRLLKSNGDTDIVVWGEEQVSQYATPVDRTITVSLDASYATVEVFDPMSGTSPIETLSNVSSVTLDLTDHPLIIEVDPTQSTSGTESSSGTEVFAGSASVLTDSHGVTWALNTSTDQIVMNGVTLGTAAMSELTYVNGNLWGETGGNWYEGFDSGGTFTYTTGLATPLESPDGTEIMASDHTDNMVDNSGNVWAINSSDYMTLNGSAETSFFAQELAYVNQAVWVENGGNWYEVATSDGTLSTLTVPAATGAAPPFESPDETEVMATDHTDSIVDHSNNTWAINSSDYMTLNGSAVTSFFAQELAYVDQAVWVENGGNWYELATTDGTTATLTVTDATGSTSPIGGGGGDDAMVRASTVSSSLGHTSTTPQLIQGSTAPAAKPAAATPAPTLSSLITSSHVAHDVIGSMGLPAVPKTTTAALHAADTTATPAGGLFAHYVPDTHHVMTAH